MCLMVKLKKFFYVVAVSYAPSRTLTYPEWLVGKKLSFLGIGLPTFHMTTTQIHFEAIICHLSQNYATQRGGRMHGENQNLSGW